MDTPPPLNAGSTDNRDDFCVNGLLVRVYNCSLINAKTECIVSPSDPTLSGRHGVSEAIAKAAGQKYTQECKTIAKKNHLNFGECRRTGAGDLPNFVHVLHVLGPHYDEKKVLDCLQHLQDSVRCVLEKTDELKALTLAFPALGCGMYSL